MAKKKLQVRKSINKFHAHLGDAQHCNKLFSYRRKSPDKAWNMLAVSENLQSAWSWAEIVFKVDNFSGDGADNLSDYRLTLNLHSLNIRKRKAPENF